MKNIVLLLAAAAAMGAFADDSPAEVHVIERASLGGTIQSWDDGATTRYTGADYTTRTAPEIGGYVFTHWSSSDPDNLRSRDVFGRAFDAAPFTLYGETTLTANYVDASLDTDNDGVADGCELYWYGDLDETADSDTDGDGATFAQELQYGTNPMFADCSLAGVVRGDSGMALYNRYGYARYIIRSEPEGELFDTVSGLATAGSRIATPAMDRVADEFGRALDSIEFAMPDEDVEYVAYLIEDESERYWAYWYGDAVYDPESDTDGDGMTFAEEMAAGCNPLMADRSLTGIVSDSSDWVEMNLQPFEQVKGAIIGDEYTEIFTSPIARNAETSETFGNGGAVWPVVADVNGDGLFDIVVCWEAGARIFVNTGSAGNPQFEESEEMSLTNGVELAMNSIAKLEEATLDVSAPSDALSATLGDADQDGVDDLLVSDTAGRIWYYRGSRPDEDGASPSGFSLQHKVWGGSFAGFAEGLRLAAVDWEDDGDLDCLAGTADGKLMLLRDPKAGRPTNLTAVGGVNNILLTWDPNAQSRIRGYRGYRDKEGVAQPQLSTYRDYPPSGDGEEEFSYEVTSLSRFYRAGNSIPIESESIPTATVVGRLGTVALSLGDAAAFGGTNVEVSLSIENSLGVGASGGEITVKYDDLLSPVDVKPSGLSENAVFSWTKDDDAGMLTLTITGGTIDAGSGTFFTLVFATQDVEEETTAGVTIDAAST